MESCPRLDINDFSKPCPNLPISDGLCEIHKRSHEIEVENFISILNDRNQNRPQPHTNNYLHYIYEDKLIYDEQGRNTKDSFFRDLYLHLSSMICEDIDIALRD